MYTRVKKLNKSEDIYARIKEMIVTGKFGPGEELTEIELSNLFGASRTPIRNALAKLSADGLVDFTPNKGCNVSKVTYKFACQMIDARTALEAYAFTACCRKKDADVIARLYQMISEQQKCFNSGDTEGFIEQDMLFHMCIVESLGNPTWLSFWKNVMDHIRRIMTTCLEKPEIRESAISVHRSLVRCIMHGDEKTGSEILTSHFDDLREDFATTIS